jgi:hypothetical protein
MNQKTTLTKKIVGLFLKSLLVFAFFLIVISIPIMDHFDWAHPSEGLEGSKHFFLNYSIPLSIPPTIAFLVLAVLLKKIRSIALRILLLIIVIALCFYIQFELLVRQGLLDLFGGLKTVIEFINEIF